MSRPTIPEQHYDMEAAAKYLQDMGFRSITPQTIKYHAYETGKLPRPKIVGRRRSYWTKSALDAFVESL